MWNRWMVSHSSSWRPRICAHVWLKYLFKQKTGAAVFRLPVSINDNFDLNKILISTKPNEKTQEQLTALELSLQSSCKDSFPPNPQLNLITSLPLVCHACHPLSTFQPTIHGMCQPLLTFQPTIHECVTPFWLVTPPRCTTAAKYLAFVAKHLV